MFGKGGLSLAVGATLLLCAARGEARADSFEALRAEGVTLYLRHAAADWSDQPPETGALDPAKLEAAGCAGKRRLTDEGRLQAQAVRAAVQGLGLTPLEISAAGLCRTFETARLLGASPKIVESLTPVPGRAPSIRAQGEAIEKIVKSGEHTRGLRIIVGDYEVAQALYGVTLGEGDGLVLKMADGGVTPVARIRAADWAALQPVAAEQGSRRF